MLIAGREVSVYELINGNGRWYWDRRYQTEAEQEVLQPPLSPDLLTAIDEGLARRILEREESMDEHSLPEGTVEITLAAYGQMLEGVQMTRETAVGYAQQMKGRTIGYPEIYSVVVGGERIYGKFRIISTRLEDDNPGDSSKGRVVAICQPLPLKSMEVK